MTSKWKPFLLYFLLTLSLFPCKAQDLDQMLEEVTGSATEYTTATFKSTRILNGHSIERMQNGQLDVRIHHRFGEVNSGAYDLWGLDQAANIFLGLEYGITDWLMVGISRSKYDKIYNGLLKFSILRQSKGEKNTPVALSILTSAGYSTLKWSGEGSLNSWDRMSYVTQLLAARKFNERFSLEINPTYVHHNMVPTELDPNDIFAIGTGMRFKLAKRFSLNAEYYYVIPPRNDFRSTQTYNPLAIGVDIETGGHVFTLLFTNSTAMIEQGFVGETTGDWTRGGIHFGFNISRVFALK